MDKIMLRDTANAHLASGIPRRRQWLPAAALISPLRQWPDPPAFVQAALQRLRGPPTRSTDREERAYRQLEKSGQHTVCFHIPSLPYLSPGTEQKRQKSKGLLRLKKFPMHTSAEAGLIPHVPKDSEGCVFSLATFMNGPSRLNSRW